MGRKSSTRLPNKPSVYVIGESPMAQEFAGVCSERGFHVYVDQAPQATRLRRNISIAIELTNIDVERKKRNLQLLERRVTSSTLILSSSVVTTVAEQAEWISHPERLIGISALPGCLSQKLIEFAPGIRTTKANLMTAQEFMMKLGKAVSVVEDRVGMVLPRILCMIINEAYFALQERIASPSDIDLAMVLGTNHPYGPIEWGERLGLAQVRAVIEALHHDLHDDRYRVAPLLKQMAMAGPWWKR